ncbi:hypothetical protein MRX96_008357 [Rhipicephalus microplus]
MGPHNHPVERIDSTRTQNPDSEPGLRTRTQNPDSEPGLRTRTQPGLNPDAGKSTGGTVFGQSPDSVFSSTFLRLFSWVWDHERCLKTPQDALYLRMVEPIHVCAEKRGTFFFF